MSRRQTWGRDDALSDAAEIQVVVRCQGNRVIGAGVQAGELLLIRISPRGISTRLLNYVTAASAGPVGPYRCPNHKEGHIIDAALLRDAIYRFSPSGATMKRGKPRAVDIKSVEFGVTGGDI